MFSTISPPDLRYARLIRPSIPPTAPPPQLRADATVAAALNAELQERVDTLAAERLQVRCCGSSAYAKGIR
jgi:hypothetical protein